MSAFGLEAHGFRNLKAVNWNLTAPALYEEAVRRGEGQSPRTARWWCCTGHAHRPLRRRQIRGASDANTEPHVWWDNNKAMSPAHFDALYADMMAYAEGRELFAKDLFGGADLTHRIRCASSPNMPGTRCSCISS